MEKNNSANIWFSFKPMVGGRITLGATKHKLFNEVGLVIGDFELLLQFKTRRVLSETKAFMSPPVCHWMESIFFVEEGELIN